MLESLDQFLLASHDSSIHALARYAARHVNANWQLVFEENLALLIASHTRHGDAAYGVYCKLLFEPLNQQLRHAGFHPKPRLPGNFSISREWGPEEERQRWSWSGILSPTGAMLGTILTIFYHDHTHLRIPRPPLVLPLQETSNQTAISALSDHSEAFKNSLEAKLEAAEAEMLLQG